MKSTGVALCAVFAATVACSDRTATNAPAGQNRLEGVRQFRLVEELQIGSVNDPVRGFTRIKGLDVDRDGQIYVFETSSMEIRVYSPAGDLLRTIGRRGEGPGEFGGSSYDNMILRFGVHGDTLWALQSSASETRITLFDRSGKLISVAKSKAIFARNHFGSAHIMPAFLLDSGWFAGETESWSETRNPVAETDTALLPRVRFRADGQRIDTVGWNREVAAKEHEIETAAIQNFPKHPIPVPTAADHLSNSFHDGRYSVTAIQPRTEMGDSVRVTREKFAGDTVFSRSYSYRATRFPDAFLDATAAESARTPGGVVHYVDGARQIQHFPDSAAAAAEIRSRMKFPEFQIPIQETFVDTEGGLWLGRESTGTATRRWIMLDGNGNPRASVEIPDKLQLLWSDGATLWAVRNDENDVPFIVRFGIRE